MNNTIDIAFCLSRTFCLIDVDIEIFTFQCRRSFQQKHGFGWVTFRRNGRLLMQQAWQFLIHFVNMHCICQPFATRAFFRDKTGNPLSGSLTTGGEDAFA